MVPAVQQLLGLKWHAKGKINEEGKEVWKKWKLFKASILALRKNLYIFNMILNKAFKNIIFKI